MEELINQEINPLKLLFQSNSGNEGLPDKIIDFFPAIVYIYDTDCKKLTYINRKITDLLGYTLNDISGLDDNIVNIGYKDDVALVTKELQKFHTLRDNESYSYNTRLNHKAGTWKYFRTIGTVLKRNNAGHVTSVLFIAQDITEETIYKAMKQENEQLLNYGTWEFDARTASFFWSDGMYRLFGYDPDTDKNKVIVTESLYRKHMSDVDFEKNRTITEAITENKERPENYSWEFQITSNDGKIKRIETSVKLIYDTEGRWLKTIGTSRDITRLRQYQVSLEEKIKDLDRSNKELEEFAYVASHDMNEPLRKITTFIERLENKYKTELGSDGQLYLSRISASVDNMRQLIDTLLEFSRTARSNQPYVRVDLNLVLAQVKSDLELKIEETVAEIKSGMLPVIEAIPSQMKQLFDNLLSNSIKFRKPDTHPSINIRSQRLTDKQKEQYHLDTSKSWFKIEFTDNGIGFEPEYSERIFQIFQRLHGKAEYPGSGIGLAICKKITEQHKGIIQAAGKPDNGATFTIILPECQ